MSESSEPSRGALAVVLMSLRDGAKLSQRGLAVASRVSQGTIRDIETGKQKKPRWDTLRMLAEGVSLGPNGHPDRQMTRAAYQALLRAAGHNELLRPRNEPPGSHVEGLFDVYLEDIGDDLEGREWLGPALSREWHITRVLDRIQSGLHLAGKEEQEMITAVLAAIAERLLPGGVLPSYPQQGATDDEPDPSAGSN